jgi:hypothetical protein
MSPTLMDEIAEEAKATLLRESNDPAPDEAMHKMTVSVAWLYLALRSAVGKGEAALRADRPAGAATPAELKALALKLSEVIDLAQEVKEEATEEGFTPQTQGSIGLAVAALHAAWGEACAMRQKLLQQLNQVLGGTADGPRVLTTIEESKRAGAKYVSADEAFKAWTAGD